METNTSNNLTLISIGGVGTVTKNMYLYICGNEILIVDCGMGFPDPSTPGVDFLIPDITYLKKLVKEGKKIVGMCLTHGHEDHIGGVPFVLDQLPEFPIFATPLTAALLNAKLVDMGLTPKVNETLFKKDISLASFTVKFIHVTHSVLDTSHIFIKTPAGNFYHGSDFKFDLTPADGNASDLHAISEISNENVLCMLSDCLGAEKSGHSESESKLTDSFDVEFRKAKGKIFFSTYSSNISRMNQAISVALKFNRKVCFMGRSFIKAKDLGKKLGYMRIPPNMEVKPQQVMKMDPSKVMVLIPGSQAQENSALVRVARDESKDIKILKNDTIIFSSDPIPGNEVNINSLIDVLSKKGARVIHSDMADDFHVSGHGFQNDIKLLATLVRPKLTLPIGGNYRHMIAFKNLMSEMGYRENEVILPEGGQEIIFSGISYKFGNKIPLQSVYVDEITGEEMEKYVLLDRQKISKEGIMIILVEVENETGKIISTPDIIARGFVFPEKDSFAKSVENSLRTKLNGKSQQTSGFGFYRKIIQRSAEELLFRMKREPLVIPVVVEV